MSKLRRFPLTYDEEFDADIHKVLLETPQKRRSERLRQLIRLGLLLDSGSQPVAIDMHSKPKSALISTVIQSESSIEPAKRVRKSLKFEPPS